VHLKEDCQHSNLNSSYFSEYLKMSEVDNSEGKWRKQEKAEKARKQEKARTN
jgi:hypothetical protein